MHRSNHLISNDVQTQEDLLLSIRRKPDPTMRHRKSAWHTCDSASFQPTPTQFQKSDPGSYVKAHPAGSNKYLPEFRLQGMAYLLHERYARPHLCYRDDRPSYLLLSVCVS